MSIRQISLNKKAFTLLEVIIALGVITMGLLGVFSLVVMNIQVQVTNKNHLIGSMLAQEGLELVRHIRDENYSVLGNAWDTDISDWVSDSYTIDYRGRAFIDNSSNSISDSGTKLYFDSGSGFYTHQAAGNTESKFSRIITILDESPNSLVVNCQVRWYDQSRVKDYISETEMHNWR